MPHLNNLKVLFPKHVETSFDDDELAFLSLTTKVEQPLRDKVAWLLNKSIGKDNLIIREWKRHDLVIMNINSQELESIVEFKNQLGFKIEHDEYKKGLCRDLYKSAVSIRDKPEGNLEKSEIIFVMFGRTLDDKPDITDPNVLQAMKWATGSFQDCNEVLNTYPIIYQEQFDNFEDDWDYWCDEACIPKNKRHWLQPIVGGDFLNIGVKIITSLIGPFSAQEIFDLNEECWNFPVTPAGKLDTPRGHIRREKYINVPNNIANGNDAKFQSIRGLIQANNWVHIKENIDSIGFLTPDLLDVITPDEGGNNIPGTTYPVLFEGKDRIGRPFQFTISRGSEMEVRTDNILNQLEIENIAVRNPRGDFIDYKLDCGLYDAELLPNIVKMVNRIQQLLMP